MSPDEVLQRQWAKLRAEGVDPTGTRPGPITTMAPMRQNHPPAGGYADTRSAGMVGVPRDVQLDIYRRRRGAPSQ